MSKKSRISILVVGMLLLLISGGTVSANNGAKARILILFDTSGSMTMDIGENATNGDGSADALSNGRYCCTGSGDSRMFIAKDAMTKMLDATGDIEFSLMKFPQRYTSVQADSDDTDWEAAWYNYNQRAGASDILRYHGIVGPVDSDSEFDSENKTYDYSLSFDNIADYLCEEFKADNSAEIKEWFDNKEYDTDLTPMSSTYSGPYGDKTQQELRADGGTPLGEAVNAAYLYLKSEIESDSHPQKDCRPWYVIILADGDYDGHINPVNGLDESSAGSNLKGVNDLRDDLNVETWVVGLAALSETLDRMADVGGCHYDSNRPFDRVPDTDAADDTDTNCPAQGDTEAGHAFLANSKASLTNILYYIISSSILSENKCDGLDNDCDGDVDEGFELFCNWDGEDVKPPADLCVDPGEICDGVDNNCNGEVDEGTWPSQGECGGGTVNFDMVSNPYTVCRTGTIECVKGVGVECVGDVGPALYESCNGLDDDCDGEIDEGLTNGGQCGTDVGECDFGQLVCVDGNWECNAVPGTSEICDGYDNDCDGKTDENYPEAGQGCYTGTDNGCLPDGTNCNDVCVAGITKCVSGGLVCQGEVNGTSEVCNGLDDDCNGTIDDGITEGGLCPSQASSWVLQSASNPKTICKAGKLDCQAAAGMVCVPDDAEIVAPGAEICDGLDNDCDGLIDEGLYGACGGCTGPECASADAGECRVGIGQCDPSKSTPGNPDYTLNCNDQGPVQEVCDGKDNDCDGDIDNEDSDMTSVAGACYPSGLPGCVSDGHGGFTCNGTCGEGEFICSEGKVICDGYVSPVTEGVVCDDKDNNCNGQKDEGIVNQCGDPIDTDAYPGAAYGVGACRYGVQYCSPGVTANPDDWGDCTGAQGPKSELCNGIDDDCDGKYEDAENADLLANNDDDPKTVDSLVGKECGTCNGVYECIENTDVTATYPLTSDVMGAYKLSCAGNQIEPEICDGLDQNCNGVADDGIPALVCGGCTDTENWDCIDTDPGAGECQEGTRPCIGISGYSTQCYGSIGPVPEKCDGRDNDCNGWTDDGLSEVNTTCREALGECSAGLYECFTDTDSATTLKCCDEEVYINSGGAECIPPRYPAIEICDGLDNDCNGTPDDELALVGETCGSGLGVCSPGHLKCLEVGDTDSDAVNGYNYICVGATTGTAEECDNEDNDCDGLVDEEIPSQGICSNAPGWNTDTDMQAENPEGVGVCNVGELVCVNGAIVCNASQSRAEVCDGLDNDCDGEIDEESQVECPVPGAICMEGQCAEPCGSGELQCPGGKECIEVKKGMSVCISSLCNKTANNALPCVFNDYYCTPEMGFTPPCSCDTLSKMCVDNCFGKSCPEGTYCVPEDYGRCHSASEGCVVTGCPEGEKCEAIDGCTDEPCQECVADLCVGASCGDGEYCNSDGKCVGTCEDVDCPAGYGCVDGECAKGEVCAGVQCDIGVLCNPDTGKCDKSVVNPCIGVVCSYYENCVSGVCEFDDCWNIDCPNGTVCITGSCYKPAGSTTGTVDSDSAKDTDTKEADTAVSTDSGKDTDTGEDTSGPKDTGPVDHTGLDNILATGAGGCMCSEATGAENSSSVITYLVMLLMGLYLAARVKLVNRRVLVKVLIAGAAVTALGCQAEPYNFNDHKDTGGRDTSGVSTDTGSSTDSDTSGLSTDSNDSDGTGGTDDLYDTEKGDECSVTSGAGCEDGETCCLNLNEIAVCTNLDSSLSHCGKCNEACTKTNATAVCEKGKCKLSVCESYFYNADSDDENGCEYYCQPTVDMGKNMDFCDGVATSADPDNDNYNPLDNDCDGSYDEDARFLTDVLNCGYCGKICQFNHAKATCENGKCQMGDCSDNWYNLEVGAGNGCETFCTGDPTAVEQCNLLDDNCDGNIDEGNPGGGGACYIDTDSDAGCVQDTDGNFKCEGACTTGSLICSGGSVECRNSGLPTLEVCDGIDNNCNGLVDESLTSSCGGNTSGDANEGLCSSGVAACDPDKSTPGSPVYDTEHCMGSVIPADELCDGYDNDCDGLVDEVAAVDGNNNNVETKDNRLGVSCGLGACAGNTQVCVNGEVKCEGGITPGVELACDGIDNDCDGMKDEQSSYQCGGSNGIECNDTAGCDSYSEGICQGGVLACDTDNAQFCNGSGGPSCSDTDHCDACDGLDNDCDGVIDEDAFYTDTDTVCGDPCHNGELKCENGSLKCINASAPSKDMCDGVNDNISEDCNPLTPDGSGDTDYLSSCDGPDAGDCKEGYWDCQGGVKFCNEDTDADVEDACDGVDNDC
ncbi:MAG: hypothetical protein JXR91_07525, partial [Deltaproteobacteria bacterium]|nr:hypothetical protein [Deltaproteobacteria bacterium]